MLAFPVARVFFDNQPACFEPAKQGRSMSEFGEIRRQLNEKLELLEARTRKISADRSRPREKDSQERAVEAENDEVLDHLDERERAEMLEIRHALERIAAGVYGDCEKCRDPIGEARLNAIPTATRCLGCA
jgi:RNA polymerase-binding transcription factor DksA